MVFNGKRIYYAVKVKGSHVLKESTRCVRRKGNRCGVGQSFGRNLGTAKCHVRILTCLALPADAVR